MYTAVLVVHIVSGVAGLLLGLLIIVRGVRFMDAYVAAVLVVCLSASGLVWLARGDLWWLVPVSGLTFGLAVLARESARRRFRGWTHGYVHGLGGSYIAQVTALVVVALVVNGPVRGAAELVPWLAPAVIGTVLIEVWRRRLVASDHQWSIRLG